MALVNYKNIADESEPSFSIDFSTYSDTSSSVFSEDEEINNLLRRKTSISLFNVSTPDSTVRHRNRSCHQMSTDRKKRKYKPYNKTNDSIKEEIKPKLDVLDENTQSHTPDISTKYLEALKEIEILQMQINKLKNERSITPIFVRRKSMQSSMIKTCLFKNSSNGLRQNYQNCTRSSLFGNDSTCMTIDIEEKSPPRTPESGVFHNFILVNNEDNKPDPFCIKVESPISDKFYSSQDPLISTKNKQKKPPSKIKNFINKFIKCPEFLQTINIHNPNGSFNNRVSPVPKIVIVSPKRTDSDSGNDSGVQQIRSEEINCNTPNVHKIMSDMSKCAEELSEKLNTFRTVLHHCLRQK